jgi:SAM-dependent methyltransferase
LNWHLLGFMAAVALLVSARVLLNPRPGHTTVEPVRNWSVWRLGAASFLTLFVELALIRWIGTEVRIFAYVKNLALLLCFLGFGLGCALAKSRIRWPGAATALLGLLMVVRHPWHPRRALEGLSEVLGAGQDIQIWATAAARNWPSFLAAAALVAVILLLLTCIFIPFGQVVSREIESAPRPLLGYSWNLAASLAGILAFFAISREGLPPAVWLGIVFLGMAFLQSEARQRIVLASFVVPAVLLLHDASSPFHFSLWTPYQQIEVHQLNFPDGEFQQLLVTVNHTAYQSIVNLSDEFLRRHPGLLREPVSENPYNLPFRFAAAAPRVLIVGSGTGNDVAGAVRNGSRAVDAVEIDPAILSLGARHPERPYQSPLVTAHLTDARAFLKRAKGNYDLAIFGLLDSHTQLSDYSNMRIDNFVYTEESFREVKKLLQPDGVLFVKFQVNQPWLGRRLAEMLADVFGKPAVVFRADSSYTALATCFVISASTQVQDRLAGDPPLQRLVAQNRLDFLALPPVPVTTDDWPYLYQQGRWIPSIFFSVSLLVVLLAAFLYWQIPEARRRAPSLFFFSMGAGFLLLETQVISRLALYFGTTWQVNGIVIGSILVALLFANAVIEKQRRPWPRWSMFSGLLGGLLLAYIVPFGRIPGSPAFVGWLAAGFFVIPVFFAGILFASEFQKADSPSAALGANMLGAVVGGLLENLSLIIGMKALLLVAVVLYCFAGLGLRTLSPLHSKAAASS